MTAWEALGAAQSIKPNSRGEDALYYLNKRIRRVVERYRFSDLLRVGNIVIPGQYTAGTISTTAGSNRVTGVGTAWPVNDKVNTTLSKATTDSPGFCEITPASMVNISEGDSLLLDAEHGASTETVTATRVGPASFWAFCRFDHDAGVSLQKSSLSGQQLKPGNGQMVFTVRAVLSATSIDLNMPFAGPALAGARYQILQLFVRVSSTARRLVFAWDPVAGTAIGTGKTVDWINLYDPQRTSSGQPQELVSTFPDNGVMQWEVWPAQTSDYGIPVIYDDGWPVLVLQDDQLPPFINPDIFIEGAQADLLRTKNIANGARQDPYFDPDGARVKEEEFERDLDRAIQNDQGRYMKFLQQYQQQMAGSANYNWQRSHVAWPSDFNR